MERHEESFNAENVFFFKFKKSKLSQKTVHENRTINKTEWYSIVQQK
jgi:hypothetical protein